MADSRAITENNYVGNGAQVLFPFSFPYISVDDVRVQLDLIDTTEYVLENATTVRLNVAPADGVKVRVYRQSNDEEMAAVFYPGSAIRSQDLNEDMNQLLYLIQEGEHDVEQHYWNKLEDTVEGGEPWIGTDEHIATNLRNDERYLKLDGPGANLTTEDEQLAGTVPDDDIHVLSNAASIERHDNVLSINDPGAQSQPGKLWMNTAEESTQYWNNRINAWVDTSGVGPRGPEGPQGPSGTITVGTTTTSAPGGEAQVTNTGTDTDAIFNFVIPRGEQGPEGPDGPQGPAGEGVQFVGQINAVAPNSAPANPLHGDLYYNTGDGAVDASWGAPAAGTTVDVGWRLAYTMDDKWEALQPATGDVGLWEIDGQGNLGTVGTDDVAIPQALLVGGSASPTLRIDPDDNLTGTGLNNPAADQLGVKVGSNQVANFDQQGLHVGNSIDINGLNEEIVVGNMRIDSNQINHTGQWSIDINNNDLMVFRDQDITTIEDLDVEGTAAPGFAINLTEGNIYRVDAVVPGDEATWLTFGAASTEVGSYFQATSTGALPAGNNATWVLDPASLHVAGNATIGQGLTVGSITFPDGSSLSDAGSSVVISQLAPLDPGLGDLWFNSLDEQLFIWDGTGWLPTTAVDNIVLNDLNDVDTESVPETDGQGLMWSAANQMWVRTLAPIVEDHVASGTTLAITDPGGADRFSEKTFGVTLDVVDPGFPAATPEIRVSVRGNITTIPRTGTPTGISSSQRNSVVGDFCDQGGYYFGRYNGRFMILSPVLQDMNNWNTSTTIQGGFARTPSLWGTFGRYPENCNWHSQKGGGYDSGNYDYGYNATYNNGTNEQMQIFYWCRSCPNGPNAGNMQSSPGGDGTGTGLNGFNDWYIGARNEVLYQYRQCKPSTEQNRVADNDATVALPLADPPLPVWTANDPTMTTVAAWQGTSAPHGGVSGIATHTNAAHWSTTQRDAEKARRISFGSGWDDNRDNKDQGCSGRAIRSTTTQPITNLTVLSFGSVADVEDFSIGMQVTQETTNATGVITDIVGTDITISATSGTFDDLNAIVGPSTVLSNTRMYFTLNDQGGGNFDLSDPTQTDPGFVAWASGGNAFQRTSNLTFPAALKGNPTDTYLAVGSELQVETRLTNVVGDTDEVATVIPVVNGLLSTRTALEEELAQLRAFVIESENRRRSPGTEVVYNNDVYLWTGEEWVRSSNAAIEETGGSAAQAEEIPYQSLIEY